MVNFKSALRMWTMSIGVGEAITLVNHGSFRHRPYYPPPSPPSAASRPLCKLGNFWYFPFWNEFSSWKKVALVSYPIYNVILIVLVWEGAAKLSWLCKWWKWWNCWCCFLWCRWWWRWWWRWWQRWCWAWAGNWACRRMAWVPADSWASLSFLLRLQYHDDDDDDPCVDLGKPSFKKSAVFLTLFKRPLPPPPPFRLNIMWWIFLKEF